MNFNSSESSSRRELHFRAKQFGFSDREIAQIISRKTVPTGEDTAGKLYFEPLTVEDVTAICELEKPDGVIVQFGGQTPLNLAHGLEAEGVPIIGTSVDSIDLAEDRGRFGNLLSELK